MGKHCQYCGSTITKLDKYGYCKRYDCFSRSGKRDVLRNLIRKCSNIYFQSVSKSLGIASCVTNNYNARTRYANGIMEDARTEFGFVPH